LQRKRLEKNLSLEKEKEREKNNYKQDLKNQIVIKRNEFLKEKENKLVEGQKIKDDFKKIQNVFEKKKQEKIELLNNQKVEEKYQSDLKRVQFFY
jgi:hypothetical protein